MVPFSAPDGSVTIPYRDGRAGERLTSGNDCGAGKNGKHDLLSAVAERSSTRGQAPRKVARVCRREARTGRDQRHGPASPLDCAADMVDHAPEVRLPAAHLAVKSLVTQHGP